MTVGDALSVGLSVRPVVGGSLRGGGHISDFRVDGRLGNHCAINLKQVIAAHEKISGFNSATRR